MKTCPSCKGKKCFTNSETVIVEKHLYDYKFGSIDEKQLEYFIKEYLNI